MLGTNFLLLVEYRDGVNTVSCHLRDSTVALEAEAALRSHGVP